MLVSTLNYVLLKTRFTTIMLLLKKIFFIVLGDPCLYVYELLFTRLVYKNAKNEDYVLFYTRYRVCLFLFAILLLIIFVFSFCFIIDYFKTVGNLLHFSKLSFRNTIIITVISFFVCTFIFLKSVFFILFFSFFKKKYDLRLFKYIKYVFSFCFMLLILLVVFCEYTIDKEIDNRKEDILSVQRITNDIKIQYPDTKVYIDRVPDVFRRSRVEVERKIVFFDSIFLNKDKNLIFANPYDEHLILMNNGYKFIKLTPTLSMYAKDIDVLNALSKSGIILQNKYTVLKIFDNKRIAKLNKLKISKDKGMQLESEYKSVHRIDELYLSKGKYKFTVELYYDDRLDILPTDKIISIKLTSNRGAVILYSKDFKKCDFTKGLNLIEFTKVLSRNRHTVNLEILSDLNSVAFIKKILYEKVE